MIAPEDCHSMRDLRKEIDTIDAELVSLLAMRARYIDRAIELKPVEGVPARIPERVAEVLEHVADLSIRAGVDPKLTVPVWTLIIEWSIAREEEILGPLETHDDLG